MKRRMRTAHAHNERLKSDLEESKSKCEVAEQKIRSLRNGLEDIVTRYTTYVLISILTFDCGYIIIL